MEGIVHAPALQINCSWLVSHYRRANRLQALQEENRAHALRELSWYTDVDGMWASESGVRWGGPNSSNDLFAFFHSALAGFPGHQAISLDCPIVKAASSVLLSGSKWEGS